MYMNCLRIMNVCNAMVGLYVVLKFCGETISLSKTKPISFVTSNLLEKIRKPFCKSNQICSKVQICTYALGALLNHNSFPL